MKDNVSLELKILEDYIDRVADGIFNRRPMYGSLETCEMNLIHFATIRFILKYPGMSEELSNRIIHDEYGKFLNKYKCGCVYAFTKFANDEPKFIECIKEAWQHMRNL